MVLGGSQSMCGCTEIEKNSLPVLGMDIRFVGFRDRREFTITATRCFDFYSEKEKWRVKKAHDLK